VASEAALARAMLLGLVEVLEGDPELAARIRAAVAGTSDEPMPLSSYPESARVLRAAIKRGELPADRVGRDLCVRPSARAAWLETRRVRPGERPAKRIALSPAERAIERARLSGALRIVSG